jgi:hypothetical protein
MVILPCEFVFDEIEELRAVDCLDEESIADW